MVPNVVPESRLSTSGFLHPSQTVFSFGHEANG
jgi:hypothetical protein